MPHSSWLTHSLKVWPEFFSALADGTKTWEVRLNDRDFQVGDLLILLEWDPEDPVEEHTGRALQAWVSYVCTDAPGLMDGYVIMSIKGVKKW